MVRIMFQQHILFQTLNVILLSHLYIYILYMIQALPVYARMVPTFICQTMLWQRSFFTITRLNGDRASTAAGATGDWPPTYFCCASHGVAHFLSSTYNNFYRICCRNFSLGFTACDTYLLYRSRLWPITVSGISPFPLFLFLLDF